MFDYLFDCLGRTILGKREVGEVGYYRRLRIVKGNLKKLAIECLLSIVGIIVTIVFFIMVLLHGGDDQCTYRKCNHDIPGYHKEYCCDIHGHECMEND